MGNQENLINLWFEGTLLTCVWCREAQIAWASEDSLIAAGWEIEFKCCKCGGKDA